MSNIDQKVKETINNLLYSFDLKDLNLNSKPIICNYSVGIEVEVKFKSLFPSLYKKYFENDLYKNSSYDIQKEISNLISIEEKDILSNLEKTVECGIPRGNDKYWEFSLMPVYDLSLIFEQIRILNFLNLIPFNKNDEHTLHITVGGLKSNSNIYWVLTIMELLFSNPKRINSGLSEDKTYSMKWASKGEGGIYKKNEYDLMDSFEGFEFRTLVLDDLEKFNILLNTLCYLLNNLKTKEIEELIGNLKKEFLNLGIQDKNWGKPHLNEMVWKTYVENFEFLKEKVYID